MAQQPEILDKYDNFDINNLQFGEFKKPKNPKGASLSQVGYKYPSGKIAPFMLQTPRSTTPFGVSVYKDPNQKEAKEDVSLSYSCKNVDSDERHRKFYAIIKSVDDKIFELAVKNKWYGEELAKKTDVMKDRQTSAIKKGKEGYADTFKTKLSTNKDGEITTEFYDANRDPASYKDCTGQSEIVGLVQLRNVYMTGKNYGASWNTMQVVNYGSSKLKGCAIKDEDTPMTDAEEEGQEE